MKRRSVRPSLGAPVVYVVPNRLRLKQTAVATTGRVGAKLSHQNCHIAPLGVASPCLIGEGGSAVDTLLLKFPEAAAQLSICRAKVYELIAAGTLPSVKVDGCRRTRASDLREFVQQLSATG